jgi:phosphoenolpyruvate carboxykinase (ATP)
MLRGWSEGTDVRASQYSCDKTWGHAQVYRTLLETINQALQSLGSRGNVRHLSADEARDAAARFGTPTRFGNLNFVSNVKNLSSALTVYIGGERVRNPALTQKKADILKSAPETVKAVLRHIERTPLARLDCAVGRHPAFSPHCSLYVSCYRPDNVRLAHMASQGLFTPREAGEPDLVVIAVPEWQEKDRQVLVFPEIGVTFVLGTDYYGEIKNAFLRMAMWRAKQNGMLGLHAGTQIIHAKMPDGGIRTLGMIMFGIAATGKTTHSCHDHGLNQAGESVRIVQDDVVFWREDGAALGSERALYIKTEGLDPRDQPLLYKAAVNPNAILENVMVDYEGNAAFDDRALTVNGHAIALREALGDRISESPDLPPIGELDGLLIAFMTRCHTVLPIASRLTPEQAAVAFMLSESIDASGSDQPAGIGSSPLIIGDASDECNMFYKLLKANEDKIECFMLNTGGVGELVEHGLDGARRVARKVTRVQITEMAAIIRGIARGTVTWREDPDWMVESPERVEDVEISKFDVHGHYEQDKIDSLIAGIRLDRAVCAQQFRRLDPAIRAAAEF